MPKIFFFIIVKVHINKNNLFFSGGGLFHGNLQQAQQAHCQLSGLKMQNSNQN